MNDVMHPQPHRRVRRFFVLGGALFGLYAIGAGLRAGQPQLATPQDRVTQEIRYHAADAEAVVFVWGVNGWHQIPELERPSGTWLHRRVMHTPMLRDGERFVTAARVLPGTTLDYGFLVTKQGVQGSTSPAWEDNQGQGYQTTVQGDGVIDAPPGSAWNVTAPITRPEPRPLVVLPIRYQMPEAEAVSLIWGIDGWTVPDSQTLWPPGTEVRNGVLSTPMPHQGDVFSIELRVPSGTTVNYGFLVTAVRAEALWRVQWAWEGDLLTVAAPGVVVSKESASVRQRAAVFANVRRLGLDVLRLVGLLLITGLLLGVVLGGPSRLQAVTWMLAAGIASGGGALVAGEMVMARNRFEPYVRTFPDDADSALSQKWIAHRNPLLGWTDDPNEPDINPQGFRDIHDFEQVNVTAAERRVMVLGDSFMWGDGVSAGGIVTRRLERLLGGRSQCYNVGIKGWGIDQMYLAYRQYRDAIRPQTVLLAFVDDDVQRVLEARPWNGIKPCLTIHDGQLVFRTGASWVERWLNELTGRSLLASVVVHNMYVRNEAVPICRSLFRQLAQEAQRRHEQLVVIRIPPPTPGAQARRPAGPLGRVDQILEGGTGARFLDATEALSGREDFYQRDGHLSGAGHAALATLLFQDVFGPSSKQLGASPALPANAR